MAREGLMDDAGWHECDYEPQCEKCANCIEVEELGGQYFAECKLKYGCEFEEVKNA